MPRPMSLRHLEVFRAVMRHGGVTNAAKVLNVSQPAVSQTISNLEAACSFPLFDRRHGRAVPTAEADILMLEVERIFTGVDRATRVIEGVGSGRWGSLVIAVFPAMAARFLPKVVSQFCAARDDVHVSVEARRSRSLIDWVAASQVDFGIGLLPAEQTAVTSQHLLSLPAVCVLPPWHRLACKQTIHATDLAGEAFISLGREDRSRFGVDKVFDDLGVVRHIRIEAEQSESACTFVACGAGVSIVDPFSAFDFDPAEICVRPFQPQVDFNLWLLTPADKKQLRLVADFLDVFHEEVRELVERGPQPRHSTK